VPAIRKCENEVIAMTASLLRGDEEVVGSLTSGTAESILLVVKTYRDMARANQPHILEPEMIVPITAHPAFVKAGALFGVRCVIVAVGPDKRCSLEAVEAAINTNTMLIVASAPQYPHGVIDPIPCLADMALEHGLPLHVDACFGAFMLPFLEKLGYDITPWDFRCAGVTSISADLHKYAYCIKGAGVLLYRSADIRAFQVFVHTEWPGKIFVFLYVSNPITLNPLTHHFTHQPTHRFSNN
jgi:sphinganine-1-phosphate aldolase